MRPLAEMKERLLPLRSGGGSLDEATLASLRRARRILVLGSSGAGKTHLSRRLSQILDIEPIHLDDHFWLPDGRPRDDREWRSIVTELAARDSWIMDGTYERSLDLRIPRAEAIVLLECPAELCLERVMRRETKTPSPQWLTRSIKAPERIDRDHATYVSSYSSVTRPTVLASIQRHARGKTLVVLEAPEAVEPFVSRLPTVSA
jgi:adenylate kinase family enzyme